MIGNIIIEIYIELVDTPEKRELGLSGCTHELIVKTKSSIKNQYCQFIADNDKVEIKEIEKPTKINRGFQLEDILSEDELCTDESTMKYGCFPIIRLTEIKEFQEFINQKIVKIEKEFYLDSEANGFRISLENNKIIEIYPNAYGSTLYFNGVDKYYPEEIKYLAGKTIYKELENIVVSTK